MRLSTTQTPLLALMRALATDERREEFAELAGTTRIYAYQLATCQRGACRSTLAKGLADASVAMNKKYGTPVVTMDELATMCTRAD